MIKSAVLLILLRVIFVFSYTHQKPVAQLIWSERCHKNEVILNDCNWCSCDRNHNFKCKARVCDTVDLYGHYKDTIQEIDVGMEGHGAWRTTSTACTPGISYRRENTLCICNEDGNWPNPTCRDIFRVLHSVQLTEATHVTDNMTCSPTKLYSVGCNVCFCPSTGYLRTNLCTAKVCSEDDPALQTKSNKRNNNEIGPNVYYADCNPEISYKIEGMFCKCLPFNRLDCKHENTGNDKDSNGKSISVNDFTCVNKTQFVKIPVDCNYCVCLEDGQAICTVRKCLIADRLNVKEHSEKKQSVSPPIDISDCKPGTKFNIDCNECQCYNHGDKMLNCTMKLCTNDIKEELNNDCVPNTHYEWKCMSCYCYVKNGLKLQICSTTNRCLKDNGITKSNIESLQGYCEPLHTYKRNCNKCKCLADGETILCTTKSCVTQNYLSINLVPYKQKRIETCPKGYSYRVDCNTCFCLANGNALCTTADCSRINLND